MGYKVTWEIDFEDEVSSPEEAAKLALDYIVNGTARVFNVETLDTGGKRMVVPTVTIDVDALEDQECEEDTSELAILTAKQRQLNRALVILGQGYIDLSLLNNRPVTITHTYMMKVRQDLLDEGLSVEVGGDYYGGSEPLPVRWDDDDFQVFYNGEWVDACSIDWEDVV